MILHIKELIQIISEFGPIKDPLTLDFRKRTKNNWLYYGIRSGDISDDTSGLNAFTHQFRDSQLQKIRPQFAILQNRLRKQLMNSIFFLDLKSGKNSEQTIAFAQVQRKLFQCKLLLRLGGERNVFWEATKGLSIALKYDLTEEALQFAVMLRSYYSKNGELSKYNLENEHVHKLQVKYNAELLAIEHYQKFITHYIKNVAYQNKTINILESGFKKVSLLRKQTKSSTIEIIYFRLASYYYDLAGDYEKEYNNAATAIEYLQSIPHIATQNNLGEFYLYQLTSSIYTKHTEHGLIAIARCSSCYLVGTMNWFIFKGCEYLFYMHQLEFGRAQTTLMEVFAHKSFPLLPKYLQDKWNLYKLYLLYAKGELRTIFRRQTKQVTSLKELLTLSETIKGDKAGFGFALRLIYILLLIEQRKFDQLTEHIDAFRGFCNRYIRPSKYPRSNAFAKLIILAESYSYNTLLITIKETKYVDRLASKQLSNIEINEDIQILPFEFIWEMILKAFKSNVKEK